PQLFDTVSWPLDERHGSGRPERLAGRVITTEAAGAIPDEVLAADMAADQDPQPGAGAAAGLFGELQRHAVGGHDVVAPDGAFVLDAKDLVEIDAAQRHKGGGGIGRRPAELGVEGGQEAERVPLDRPPRSV